MFTLLRDLAFIAIVVMFSLLSIAKDLIQVTKDM